MKKQILFANAAVVALAVGFFAGAGCGRKAAEQANGATANAPEATEDAVVEEPWEPDVCEKLFMDASQLYSEGATNETVALLEKAFGDETYAAAKPQILQSLVRLLMELDRIDQAKARVFETYASGDGALSESVMGSIYFNYVNAGDTDAALAWTDQVLALEALAPQVRRAFIEWNLNGAIEAGDDARAAKAAEALLAAIPANDSVAILRRTMETTLSRGKLDLLATILGAAEKADIADEAAHNMLAVMGLRLLAQRGEWDALAAKFDTVKGLPDRELLYALRNTIPLADKAGNAALVEKICSRIAADADIGPLSFGYAARQWVDSASKRGSANVPPCLDSLVNRGNHFAETTHVFVRHAYDDIDNPEFTPAMKAIGERLLAATGENARSSLRTILLDYSFILEDYDTALKILEERLGDYDDNWHAMATSKIKAHKAMKEKRPLDAIREFRAFMEIIKESSDSETSDPSTGVVHSKEMILGRNAARIGDLYKTVPDEASAAAAYAEARAYYATAKEKATDEATLELIRKEVAAIPGE